MAKGQKIDELYISLGLDIARLQLDFDTAGRTVSQTMARLNSESKQLTLKTDIDLTKLEGAGKELDQLKIKYQAINQQLDIQRQKEQILATVVKDAHKTSGEDSGLTRQAETNLLAQCVLQNTGSNSMHCQLMTGAHPWHRAYADRR